MRSKLFLTQFFLFGSVLTIAACNKSGPPSTSSTSSENTIRIGEVGTMTGTEASFGVGTHRGIQLAVDEINSNGGINGKKIELISRDDQGKPEETTSAATQLISRYHVTALIGGLPSSRTMAMAPIAQENKTLLVSPSGTNPKVTDFGDYIFRVCFIDPFQGHVMAKFALQNLKMKNIAILRDIKSDYSIGLAQFFAETLKKGGGSVVTEQSYSSGDIDFKSQLTAIRAKGPQAIFIPGYYTEAALIARQARELGMKIPLLGGDGFDSPKFLEIGGNAVNGTYFSTHYSSEDKSPLVQNFISKFKETYHIIPDGLSTLGYDAVMVLADAIKRASSLAPSSTSGTGSTPNSMPSLTAIRDALAHTQNFPGITGNITLDSKRNPVKPAVIQIVEGNRVQYHTSIMP